LASLAALPCIKSYVYNKPLIKREHFDAINLLLDRGADVLAVMQWNGTNVSGVSSSDFDAYGLQKKLYQAAP
jgi:hypothetical protein